MDAATVETTCDENETKLLTLDMRLPRTPLEVYEGWIEDNTPSKTIANVLEGVR